MQYPGEELPCLFCHCSSMSHRHERLVAREAPNVAPRIAITLKSSLPQHHTRASPATRSTSHQTGQYSISCPRARIAIGWQHTNAHVVPCKTPVVTIHYIVQRLPIGNGHGDRGCRGKWPRAMRCNNQEHLDRASESPAEPIRISSSVSMHM